jgi:hypothetical protein
MNKSIVIFLGFLTFLIPVASSINNSNALAFKVQQPGDSTDLTAMEKITKLKTQWLSQLPAEDPSGLTATEKITKLKTQWLELLP